MRIRVKVRLRLRLGVSWVGFGERGGFGGIKLN